jgi:hypothetical protein
LRRDSKRKTFAETAPAETKNRFPDSPVRPGGGGELN